MVSHQDNGSTEFFSKSGEILRMLQKSNKNAPELRDLLTGSGTANGPDRFADFSRSFEGLFMDFSRTSLTSDGLAHLLSLARSSGVEQARQDLFAGQLLNQTEDRRVLHHLWRGKGFHDCLNACEADEMERALTRANSIARSLSAGRLPPHAMDGDETRQQPAIRHLIHIGIGGSLLGPKMLCEAMPHCAGSPNIHFLSSVDAHHRDSLLQQIDPRETAVVLVSKSFTTPEVLLQGRRVLDWMAGLNSTELGQRLFAITSALESARAFGIDEDHILPMGDWTGGRYSMWSPVGLTAMVSMGIEAFESLRRGGASMDEHFRTAPLEHNLPVLMGLLRIWHRNVMGYTIQGCIPYDSRLQGLPGWLQQLEMESNGKSVQLDGTSVQFATAPIVIGDCGTDAQHSLFQSFHQGTTVVPLDFIAAVNSDHADQQAHDRLLSNMLAQATALAMGRGAEQVRELLQSEGMPDDRLAEVQPHRVMPGNRPSCILLVEQLDPENLGRLLVLYEQAVFVSSVVWNINAFDQWGVELGKSLAAQIEPMLADNQADGAKFQEQLSGLEGLIAHIRRQSGK